MFTNGILQHRTPTRHADLLEDGCRQLQVRVRRHPISTVATLVALRASPPAVGGRLGKSRKVPGFDLLDPKAPGPDERRNVSRQPQAFKQPLIGRLQSFLPALNRWIGRSPEFEEDKLTAAS